MNSKLGKKEFPIRDSFFKTWAYAHSLKKTTALPMDRASMRWKIEVEVYAKELEYRKVLQPKEEDILKGYEKKDPFEKVWLES